MPSGSGRPVRAFQLAPRSSTHAEAVLAGGELSLVDDQRRASAFPSFTIRPTSLKSTNIGSKPGMRMRSASTALVHWPGTAMRALPELLQPEEPGGVGLTITVGP